MSESSESEVSIAENMENLFIASIYLYVSERTTRMENVELRESRNEFVELKEYTLEECEIKSSDDKGQKCFRANERTVMIPGVQKKSAFFSLPPNEYSDVEEVTFMYDPSEYESILDCIGAPEDEKMVGKLDPSELPEIQHFTFMCRFSCRNEDDTVDRQETGLIEEDAFYFYTAHMKAYHDCMAISEIACRKFSAVPFDICVNHVGVDDSVGDEEEDQYYP